MSKEISIKHGDYRLLVKQAAALIKGESDCIANAANLSALLFNQLEDVNWAGFYFVKNTELVLGPFQGQVACSRIPLDRGVCGKAATTAQVQRVADVHQFDGHVACDAASNSEIVIPLIYNQKVIAVLDLDSPELARFDEIDQQYLVELANVFIENTAFGLPV